MWDHVEAACDTADQHKHDLTELPYFPTHGGERTPG